MRAIESRFLVALHCVQCTPESGAITSEVAWKICKNYFEIII